MTQYRIILNNNYLMKYPKDHFNNEEVRFVNQVEKINRRNVNQMRNLLVTNKNIYNLKKQQIKRTISNTQVSAIIMSKVSNEFVLKINNEYDYRFSTSQRWKIYKEIIDLSNQYSFRKPDLFLVDQHTLQQYTKTSQCLSCKIPSFPVEFNEQQKINLNICNLLQTDHRVLYVYRKDIYEIRPHQFVEILQLGRFTHLVKNSVTSKYLIKKTIPKHLLKIPVSDAKKQFSNYKQRSKKQRIYFVLENPDSFVVFSECYKYTIAEEISNFHQHSEEEIKKICQKVLCLLIQQELQDLFIENVLFNQKYEIMFTQFQNLKPYDQAKIEDYLSPQQYYQQTYSPKTKSKKTIFWKLGIFLYKLVYGVSPIPADQAQKKIFYKKKVILYDNQRKSNLSIELQNFMADLLEFNQEMRMSRFISSENNIILAVLKQPWFLKN